MFGVGIETGIDGGGGLGGGGARPGDGGELTVGGGE